MNELNCYMVFIPLELDTVKLNFTTKPIRTNKI